MSAIYVEKEPDDRPPWLFCPAEYAEQARGSALRHEWRTTTLDASDPSFPNERLREVLADSPRDIDGAAVVLFCVHCGNVRALGEQTR